MLGPNTAVQNWSGAEQGNGIMMRQRDERVDRERGRKGIHPRTVLPTRYIFNYG